ncbi:MAG: hypothetical protein V4594_09475 [Bacteroidota bacterium]
MSSLKETFAKLTESYIAFTLFRSAIIITVVLTLFGSQNSKTFKETLRNYDKVIKLRDTSWGVPMTDSWMVNRMFPYHGIYDKDSITALYEAHTIQTTSTGYNERLKTLYATHEPDTVKMNGIIKQQDSLLVNMSEGLKTAFSLNLAFISNTKVDLQYWIYLLPFIYALSAIYLGIVNTKIRLIVSQSNQLALNPETEALSLKPFDMYPFLYLKQLLVWIEIIFLVLFCYTYYTLLLNIPGFFVEVFLLIQLGAYYSVLYYLWLTNPIVENTEQQGRIRNVVSKGYLLLRKLASKFVKTKRIKRYTILGNILILSSLYAVMATKGCKRESVTAETNFLYHYNGRWLQSKALPDEQASNDYSGFELIKDYSSKIWDFGRDGIFLNRVLQVFYALTILATICLIFTLLVRFIWKKTIGRTQWIIHYATIFISISFLTFIVYYGTDIFSLSIRCIFVACFLYIWINFNTSNLKFSNSVNYSLLSKSTIAISLPFFLIMILKTSKPLWAIINATFSEPSAGLMMIALLSQFYGYLVLPFGLSLLLVGMYKIQRLRSTSN